MNVTLLSQGSLVFDPILADAHCSRRVGVFVLSMTSHTARHANVAADSLVFMVGAVAATETLVSWRWLSALALCVIAQSIWFLASARLRSSDVSDSPRIRDAVVRVVLLLALTFGPIAVLCVSLPQAWRPNFLAFAPVVAPLLLATRLLAVLSTADAWTEYALVVGVGPLGRHTGLNIQDASAPSRLCGYLRFAHETLDDRLPAPVLGTVADLAELLGKRVFDRVFFACHGGSHRDEIQAAISVLEGAGIPFALPVGGFRFGRARPGRAVADGYLHYSTVQRKPVQRAFKRAFDVVAAALALVLLSPLVIAAALLIKVTSRGPAFVGEDRVGLRGRVFQMLKFRTTPAAREPVRPERPARPAPQASWFPVPPTRRLTLVQRLLGKGPIDALPQLVNVLRGDMSIVGPCPRGPAEVSKYPIWKRRRLSVLPGLTCPTARGNCASSASERNVSWDIRYIDDWTLAGDFRAVLALVGLVRPKSMEGAAVEAWLDSAPEESGERARMTGKPRRTWPSRPRPPAVGTADMPLDRKGLLNGSRATQSAVATPASDVRYRNRTQRIGSRPA